MIESSRTSAAAPRSRAGFPLKAALICLAGFVVLNATMLWRGRDYMVRGYGDFASFYTAGKIVRQGQSARLYDPYLQWNIQQQFASTVKIRLGPLPYIHPPFEALLFLPFAYLSYPAACAAWIALKLILLLSVPFLLPRWDEERPSFSMISIDCLLCLSYAPVAFDLIQGQDSIVLLFIFVLAFKLLLRGEPARCGALLALGLFKFHFTIPLLVIFALRKQVKLVIGFLAMASGLFAISLAMVHWQGILKYPLYLWHLNQTSGLGMVKPQSMPNIRGLVTVFLGNGPSLPQAAYWFLGAVLIFGVVVASRSWRGNSYRSLCAAFCFMITVVLATSSYANVYDLSLLLIPFLVLGRTFLLGTQVSSWPRSSFLASAAVLLFTPFAWTLALKLDQFCWMGLVVAAFAISIYAAQDFSHVTLRAS
jgi:hypothetical protein